MTEHECKQIFALLSEYLDEQLPERTCAELEEHLKNCPPCISFLESLRKTVRLCQGLDCTNDDLRPLDANQVADLRQAYRQAVKRRSKPDRVALPES